MSTNNRSIRLHTSRLQAIAVRGARAEHGATVAEFIVYLAMAWIMFWTGSWIAIEYSVATLLKTVVIGVATVGAAVVVVRWVTTAVVRAEARARHERIKDAWGAYLLDNGGWPAVVDVSAEDGRWFLDRWQHADELAGTRREAWAYDEAVVELDRSHRAVCNALRTGR